MDFRLEGPVTIRTEDGDTEKFEGSIMVETPEMPDIGKAASGSSSSSDIVANSSSSGSGKALEELALENIEDMKVEQLRELMQEYRR